MLSAVVISQDTALDTGLRRFGVESGQVTVLQTLGHNPNSYELVRFINSSDPDVVFVDLRESGVAANVTSELKRRRPQLVVIGVDAGAGKVGPNAFPADAVISTPLTLEQFESCVRATFRRVRRESYENLVAFLPAKAGDGCSLTAFNTAATIATEMGRRVLLIDGDPWSGVLSVRARFEARPSLYEALQNPSVLTRSEWPRLTVARQGLDILPAGRRAGAGEPRWSNLHHLLRFCAAEYETVVADLPESMGEATADVVFRAASVCVVCTPEIPSVDLARDRITKLVEMGVLPGRISVVANRWREPDQETAQMFEMLGQDVTQILPDDAAAVRSAISQGRQVARDTELSAAYLALAHHLLGLPRPVVASKPKSKFRLAALLGR